MPPVTVLLLAPLPDPAAGSLERLLDEIRTTLLERHRAGFEAAGAARVVTRQERPDDTPFGARLRRLVDELAPDGLVVMGAGSMPLARPSDLRAFVEAAAAAAPGALANHRYSADCIAISQAATALRDLPEDLASDNALPRWLAEHAGIPVRDLHARRRLAADIDSPVDALVLAHAPGAAGLPLPSAADAGPVLARLAALRRAAADPGAELLVAGRLASSDLRWVETNTRSRTRALVEERGLRTAAAGALVGRPNRRPARSVLGLLLDRDGPGALGERVAELADGAVIDSRVLLAHRLGADEHGWPAAEDRFASDLLLPDRVRDPWLAELTASATGAPVPILLGGHGLVGPGIRWVLRGGRG
jgi:CTP:molybdopterin cytidylyltransferase MocA